MRMTKVYPITKVLPQEWEEWLEKFEAEGWHLEKVSLGGYIYQFVKGKARKVRYCCDYHNKKKGDYEAVFKDTGWELLYYFGGYYIWRKEYENQRPEAFTDMDSLVSRNNKLISLYFACFLPYFSFIPMFIRDGASFLLWGLILLVSILLVVGISRLFYANKKLKKV